MQSGGLSANVGACHKGGTMTSKNPQALIKATIIAHPALTPVALAFKRAAQA